MRYIPGFAAERSISVPRGRYGMNLRPGSLAGVILARGEGDRPRGGGGPQDGGTQSCVTNCSGDCAGLQGQARSSCIAKCVQGCSPPEQTLPAGPGQPGSININIDNNTVDAIAIAVGILSGAFLVGGFAWCVRQGGDVSMGPDGVSCSF
jgi:hypothetical protein